jgi:MinD-like ATPase involved in chromosome partitioning or flagellar assembly
LGLWPDATPFRIDDGEASSVLTEIVRGPSAALTAVVLVAGPRARASGWAARAAFAVARQWRGSRPVVLADLDLERPVLHELAGVTNEEGAAELIEFGLSLAAARHATADGAFHVLPAGVYAPDPGAVLRADAWSRVILEVATQRHTLLLYVPADAAGADAVVDRAGAVLVLAEADEADSVIGALARPYSVIAVLVPMAEPAVTEDEPVVVADAAESVVAATEDEPVVVAEAAESVLEAAAMLEAADGAPGSAMRRLSDAEFDAIRLPTERESRDALIADMRDRQRAARMTPPGQSEVRPRDVGDRADALPSVLLPTGESEHAREMRLEAAADDVDLDTMEPSGPAQPPPRRSYRRPLAWTLFVVLMLSLLAGAWRYLAGRLGWGFPIDGGTQPSATSPDDTPFRPSPVADVALPYVVAMEAHADVAAATERILALRSGEPRLSFHVAPLEREGTLYYHVMAGPVPDSLAAVALRDTLLARRLKRAATPNDIRYSPLAFHIGDYGTRHVAEQTIHELLQLDVPAYFVLADAADGEPLYRVYVGAFTSPAEAEVTRQLLRAVGIQDSLVTRTGSIVQ